MGKVWKRRWLRNKLEETTTKAPVEIAAPKPAPKAEPEPVVEEKKVKKPKETKKASSKGYRRGKKLTAKKADK